MGHIEKIKTRADFTKARIHCLREQKSGFYKNNVDLSKSHENVEIRMFWDYGSTLELIDNTVERKRRKDAVIAIDCCWTMPKDEKLNGRTAKEWAEDVLEAYEKSMGLSPDFCVGAVLHMDETNPHLHVYHVPITQDGRLSCKSISTRKALLQLHDRMQAYMNEKGYVGTYVNPDHSARQKGKSLNVQEYKQAQDLQKRFETLQEHAEKLQEAFKPQVLGNGFTVTKDQQKELVELIADIQTIKGIQLNSTLIEDNAKRRARKIIQDAEDRAKSLDNQIESVKAQGFKQELENVKAFMKSYSVKHNGRKMDLLKVYEGQRNAERKTYNLER